MSTYLSTPAGNAVTDVRKSEAGGVDVYTEEDPDCPVHFHWVTDPEQVDLGEVDKVLAQRQEAATAAADEQALQAAMQPQIEAFTTALAQNIADNGVDITNPDAVESAASDTMTAQENMLTNDLAQKSQLNASGAARAGG